MTHRYHSPEGLRSMMMMADSFEVIKRLPDNHFDLAVVDPPYGSDNIQGGYTSGRGGGVASQKKYHQKLWSQQSPTLFPLHDTPIVNQLKIPSG